MTAFRKPLDEATNTLLELKALVRMALFHAEGSEPAEFADLKSDLVAMYYMMLDKANAAIGNAETMYRAEIRTEKREARH